MEQTNLSSMSGGKMDQDTFRRVWERVMPDQAASPIDVKEGQVPETALPGVADEAPQSSETSGVPQAEQPEAEAPQPELPDVPACQEKEEGACPCTGEPELCLGEGSSGDSRRLEELMSMARRGMQAGRLLSGRACGSCTKESMGEVTRDHRQALRRMSAAYFLITGKHFHPCCPPPQLPARFDLALREQFMWEQRWEHCNSQAAENTQDPCLRALYEELAQEGRIHAGAIRSMLEQMA